jgi:hypothetical protein
VAASSAFAQRPDGQWRVEIVDGATGQPRSVRFYLKNARGRPVAEWRGDRLAPGGAFFYIHGQRTLPLPIGQYTFEIEAGPEYRTLSGHFEIERHADDSKRFEMERVADMPKEGWWAGDVDAEGLLSEETPLVLIAEGLHVLPLVAWSNQEKQFDDVVASLSARQRPREPAVLQSQAAYGYLATRDESAGGGLLLFGPKSPPNPLRRTSPVAPTSLTLVNQLSESGGRIVARSATAWDLPLWLASGNLDAITLIDRQSARGRTLDENPNDRPRDRQAFPGVTGHGRWAETIYHHVLNCGLRIPPVAGSPKDTSPDAGSFGTNRVYAYLGDDFSYENWWDAVSAGRVVVTNGPLLRPRVAGHPPGHVFHIEEGGKLSLEIALSLTMSTSVEYLEVIQNGEVVISERLSDWVNKKGRLPPLEFNDNGWFLVRAVTTDQRKYQLASTGPYYVEKAGRPRISKRSVEFFLTWIAAASERITKLPSLDEATRAALLSEQANAREFFSDLLSRANAE